MKIKINAPEELQAEYLYCPNPTILTERNIIPNIMQAINCVGDRWKECTLQLSPQAYELLIVAIEGRKVGAAAEVFLAIKSVSIDRDLPEHEFYIFNDDQQKVEVLYTIRVAGENIP